MTEEEYYKSKRKNDDYESKRQAISIYKDIITSFKVSETPRVICGTFNSYSHMHEIGEFLSESKEKLISRLNDKIEELKKQMEEL